MRKEFSLLLPRVLRPLGFIFAIIGFVLAFIRFHYGYKPEILHGKVFALYSYYLESKSFQLIKNQLLEEIAGIFLIVGLFFIAFAKEKVENTRVGALRFNAFLITIYLNTFFILLALIFTFGLGFVYMLIINMGQWLVIYIITFRLLLLRDRYKQSTS